MITTTITGTDNLTLEQVKKQINLTISDDDAQLTTMISVSLSAVEGYCRSLFIERENTQVFSVGATTVPALLMSDVTQDSNSDTIELTYVVGTVNQTVTVSKLNLFNQDTNHYTYILNKLQITIVDNIDIDADSDVTIVWKVGKDSNADAVHHARLLLCGTYYENREGAVAAFQNSLPNGVEFLLEPYMQLQVG